MADADRRIAVAVVIDGRRVLVGRRPAAAADAAGLHEFPGGKVECGETPQAAARREVREETGLDVTVGPPILTTPSVASIGAIEIVFLQARPENPTASPRPPFAWVPIDRLGECAFPEANRDVLGWLARASFDHGGS